MRLDLTTEQAYTLYALLRHVGGHPSTWRGHAHHVMLSLEKQGCNTRTLAAMMALDEQELVMSSAVFRSTRVGD